MARPPLCINPSCRQPMTYLGEGNDNYQFQCPGCHSLRLISKPQTQAAARNLVNLKRQALAEKQRRDNPHRVYSFGGK